MCEVIEIVIAWLKCIVRKLQLLLEGLLCFGLFKEPMIGNPGARRGSLPFNCVEEKQVRGVFDRSLLCVLLEWWLKFCRIQ